MPQRPAHIVRLEEEIEEVIDLRLIAQADRSMWRAQVDACTERLRALRDRYIELERRLQAALLPHPATCAVRSATGPLRPPAEGPGYPDQ